MGDFVKKTHNWGSISKNAILFMADVVGLHPSTPHEAGLKALRKVLVKREKHYSFKWTDKDSRFCSEE